MSLSPGAHQPSTEQQEKSSILDEPDSVVNLQPWHEFDEAKGSWAQLGTDSQPASSDDPVEPDSSSKQTSTLSLVTWNVDAFTDEHEDRMAGILSAIRNQASLPDVLFFQEVSIHALYFLLSDSWIRSNWYSSEADLTHWAFQSFATMILLSKHAFTASSSDTTKYRMGRVWRVEFPSMYGRDALCCDVHLPTTDTPVRLITVHLDSLAMKPSLRPRQLAIVSGMLHRTGRGLVAGDFNPVLPEDHGLVAENGLVDAWTELRPGEGGYTWGVDGKAPFPPSRLDKVAMVGLKARDIEIMHPGLLPRPSVIPDFTTGTVVPPRSSGPSQGIPWSDHSGLKCTLEISEPE